MAGGVVRFRHLSRKSSARQALLRGLVTQLVQYEHIQTTHAKAKEAQRLAEKLITLAKKNTEGCRRSAQGILYRPHLLLPKVFGELRERYLERQGGYTRVMRTEPKNIDDQAESSILEFVDGPKDSRFMLMAKTVARDRLRGRESTLLTTRNVKKLTQFRGEEDFEQMVRKFMELQTADKEEDPEDEDDEDEDGEAAIIAQKESAAAQRMAPRIVPESAKNVARESQRPRR